MNKKIKSLTAVYAIVFIAYCILFFVIPFQKTAAAWVTFVFTVISICGGCGIAIYAFSGEGLKSKIYGFPIFKIGFSYTAAQLAFSAAVMISGFFAAIPLWVSLAVSVVILALTTIGVIGADNARDIISEQEARTRNSTGKMKTFRLDMRYIVDSCGDAELKKPLEKLADSFKYADPVSNEALSDIEDNLRLQVKTLAGLVNTDAQAAAAKIDEISVILADRNRRCKELKD